MHPKFIKQPNALIIPFGQYNGQILSSSISTLGTNVTMGVASFCFSDLIVLDVPHSNFQYFSLLRTLNDTITFLNIGVEYKVVSKRLKKNLTRFLSSYCLYSSPTPILLQGIRLIDNL